MFKKIKTLLFPITLAKKEFSIYFFGQFFDWFRSIFIIQLLAFIIWAIQSKNLSDFYFWIAIFILIELISIILAFISNIYFAKTFYKAVFALDTIYLNKYIKLDNNKTENLWTWRINSIIYNWLSNWKDIAIWNMVDIFIIFLSIIYAFVVILFSAWIYYFIIFLSLFLFSSLVTFFWNNLSLKYRKLRKNEITEFDRNYLKIIMSKFEILQNSKFSSEINKLKKNNDKAEYFRVKEEIIWSFWITIMRSTFLIMQLMIFFWLWLWVLKGTVQFSNFILLNWLLGTMNSYIWNFSKQFKNIWATVVHVDKLFETFDNITEIPWINNPINFECKYWNIEIKDVTYCYNDTNNVFDKFDLLIEWWKKTAFVWPSWWWKTTLIKLIANYIHPISGNIIVDNQDLSKINLISYYKNIWYLTQDPSVFDWTIMENLTYALIDKVDQSKLDEVIKLAKCDFIYELPNKLETEIWERWVKLSWWQKQRLAIAKIMLKNPEIILLDEPTSAMDSFNEEEVTQALNNLFNSKTVVIVAHRLQTVKQADIIYYIENWIVVEKWNHEELMNKNWKYMKMIELQSGF